MFLGSTCCGHEQAGRVWGTRSRRPGDHFPKIVPDPLLNIFTDNRSTRDSHTSPVAGSSLKSAISSFHFPAMCILYASYA